MTSDLIELLKDSHAADNSSLISLLSQLKEKETSRDV